MNRLAHLFRFFAATQCRGRSAVYETLANAVADDEALLELLADTPADQRRPSLLFAAVNHVLAGQPEAELAAYYPIHGGRRDVDQALVPAFRRFCEEHRDELTPLLRDRSTQTNEIRRCVALRLALDHVGRAWQGPFALVEMGASAGLNLFFDRYGYRIGGRDSGPASPVTIECELRGPNVTFGAMPKITSRLGIDQRPVDVSDPDARDWLAAFIWPEDTGGLATLRSAMELARQEGPPTLVEGDATSDTARLIERLPGDEPVVVFTASLLSYLDQEARDRFGQQLDEAAEKRPLAWAFMEGPGLLATMGLNIEALQGPLASRNDNYAVGTSRRGEADELLALADTYGSWLAPQPKPGSTDPR